MNTLRILSSIALGLGSLTPVTAGQVVDATRDGWVSHASDHQLTICYRSTPPPAVGSLLEILRTSYIVPNKGAPREQFMPGGHAIVVAIADDARCVRAELTHGDAQRADHAREVHG
ncbi:MAG: hypothetical protein EPN49_00710 [Rhodanobacter sp.]|nr:MAG: hypothetical protein EPN49_00710 [Rhodanobacter sp.]